MSTTATRKAVVACALVAVDGCRTEPFSSQASFGHPPVMVWFQPIPGGGRVSQDESRAYFPGANNELIAIDKSTGHVAWRSPTRAGSGLVLGVGTAISDPVVVMGDFDLFAFDRVTGARRWVFTGDPGSSPANANPAANDSVVFSGSGVGLTWAIRAATGEVIWRRPPPVSYRSLALDPVVDGDMVFVGYASEGAPDSGENGALGALDAATGQVRWLHDFGQYVNAGESARCLGDAVIRGNTVYVSFGRGDVVALERTTGALKWHHGPPPRKPYGDIVRRLAFSSGTLVVGSTQGDAEGLDPETGQQRWARHLSFSSIFSPLVADDSTVYVSLAGGEFAAIDAASGSLRWNAGLTHWSFGAAGTAAVDDRNVYVAGVAGLYSLRK